MGNCHALSKSHPTTPILNLDIGGGTTNLALGLDGQVLATGCLFVGARHFEFVPGGIHSDAAVALCRGTAGASEDCPPRGRHAHAGRGRIDSRLSGRVDRRRRGRRCRKHCKASSRQLHTQAPFALPPLDRAAGPDILGRRRAIDLRSSGRKTSPGPRHDLAIWARNWPRDSSPRRSIASRMAAVHANGAGPSHGLRAVAAQHRVIGHDDLSAAARPAAAQERAARRPDRRAHERRPQLRQLLELAARAKPAGCLRVEIWIRPASMTFAPGRSTGEAAGRRRLARRTRPWFC